MLEQDNPYEVGDTTQLSHVSAPPSNRPHSFALGMTLLVLSIATCLLALNGVVFFCSQPKVTFADPILYGPILIVVWNAAIAFGAIGILRRGSLTAARITVVMAMIPFLGPIYLVGFFLGFWGLAVVNRPDVIESINATARNTFAQDQHGSIETLHNA